MSFFSHMLATPHQPRHWLQLPADAYAVHQLLWQLFPGRPAGTPQPFIFRDMLQPAMTTQGITLALPHYYLVSDSRPVLPAHLADSWQLQTRDYAPVLQPGQRLQFDVRVNPVMDAVVRDDQGDPLILKANPAHPDKPVYQTVRADAVWTAKQQWARTHGFGRWQAVPADRRPAVQDVIHQACLSWFNRRCSQWGIAPLAGAQLRTDRYLPNQTFRQSHQKQASSPVMLSTVDLLGELEVTDPVRLGESLIKGIGKARSFGCGLLLIRPVAA